MKRENYEITFNNETIIKHAWNASNREIEKQISIIAKSECQDYTKTGSTNVLHPTAYKKHISGTRTWVGDDGTTIVFSIKLL